MDAKGAVVGLRHHAPDPPDAEAALVASRTRTSGGRGRRRASAQALAAAKATGADVAAVGLTGQMHGLVLLDAERARPAARHPLERPAHGGGVRRDPRPAGRPRGAGAGHRQRRPHRLHRPEDPVGAQARARGLRAGRASCCCPRTTCACGSPAPRPWTRRTARARCSSTCPRATGRADVLDRLEIPPGWLPPTFEGPEVTGTVTAEAAAETGLRAGTPVVAGGGDQAAGAVGAGAVRAGRGVAHPRHVGRRLRLDGARRSSSRRAGSTPSATPCPARWHFMGVTLSAAGSLQWYRDTLAAGESFDALVAEAETVARGQRGAALPSLPLGRADALPGPAARGAFVGLTVRHGRGHLTRAVLEGVAFSMRDCFAPAEGGRASGDVDAGAGGGGGGQERALAADLRERARGRARDREQHGRSGLRGRPPGRGGRGRLPERATRPAPRRWRSPGARRPIPAGRSAYDALYPRVPRALPGPEADVRPPRRLTGGSYACILVPFGSSSRRSVGGRRGLAAVARAPRQRGLGREGTAVALVLRQAAWKARLGGLGHLLADRLGRPRVRHLPGRPQPATAGRSPDLIRGEEAKDEKPLGGGAPREAPTEFLVEAFDRKDGRRLWQHRAAAEGELPEIHEKHNLASPSPVTDGEIVFAWFGNGQIVALSRTASFSGSATWPGTTAPSRSRGATAARPPSSATR